jgi:hypothetical protein
LAAAVVGAPLDPGAAEVAEEAAVVDVEDFEELEHAPATTAARTTGTRTRNTRGVRTMGQNLWSVPVPKLAPR